MLQESDIKFTAFLSLCQRALFQPIEIPVTMKLQSNYFNIILTKVFDKRSGKERKECSERGKGVLNPFTPKISSVILLTICHTILMMLVGEFGIGSTCSPIIEFSSLSSFIHTWELNG